ncbi:MAG: VCBS repeat-containing protein [Bacteroidales bacterium]|nr:VCBS repeat-containing protein [Bacteroidales bacterium]
MKNLLASVCTAVLLTVFPAVPVAAEGGLCNAARIMSGEPDGLERMSFKAIYSSVPIGFAYLSGHETPDFLQNCSRGMPYDCGLYLCTPDGKTPEGSLIYKQSRVVDTPWGKKLPSRLRLFQDGKDIFLVSMGAEKLTVTLWNGHSFEEYISCTYPKIENLAAFDIIRRDKRGYELVLLVNDGGIYEIDDPRETTLSRYDGAGVYRGQLPRGGLMRMYLDNDFQAVTAPEQITPDNERILGPVKVAAVRSSDGSFDGYVMSGKLGALKFVPYMKKYPKEGVNPVVLREPDGKVLLHRAYSNQIMSFPSCNGDRSSLLVGGECALYLYSHVSGAEPVFNLPQFIWEREAPLYGGSLTVPNVVDWDGDGVLDIVAGNSEGRLLFFKNKGSNAEPSFATSAELCADGEPIRFRGGYNIVQGPFEGAWGYLCPTVFDWNADGLPDVIFNGSRSVYEVMINVGTLTEPELSAPRNIRYDGMELHGTWRVRPALYREDGETYMIIMDDENALHRYRRLDDTFVEDAGKVLLTDGRQITGHNNAGEGMGQRGRGKLRLFDWDGDGDLDLFIGSVKRSSYPSPENGLPYRRFKKKQVGMQVMYFENAGDMKFKAPRQLQVDGKDFYLGAHSNAPEPCMLGDTSSGPNLVVGCESGKYWFFEHSHITYTE